MDRDLQTILIRDNPWIEDESRLAGWLHEHLPQVYIPRGVVAAHSARWRTAGRAHLVVGPRQAGKSTALWAHLAQVGSKVLHIDCEQSLTRSWCSSPQAFLEGLDDLVGEPVTLLFDEIQHLHEAGLFIKGLVDRKHRAPLLVTGSSSFHLGAGTRESLAGRATRSRLLPLNYVEVCSDVTGSRVVRERILERRFDRHVRFGGYPEVWLSEAPSVLLTDLVNSIILRDASDLHRIRRPEAFRRLLRLAAGQTGSLVNLSEWSSVLGIDRDTVAAYLEILESGHVLVRLGPYAGGRRSELTSHPKIFLVDCGLRNQLVGDYRPLDDRTDRGALLENWVFSEIWKSMPDGGSLHFWRSTSGAEVDFVLDTGRLLAVEVKSAALAKPRLSRSSRSFIEVYEPDVLLVVNTGIEHEEPMGRTRVIWTAPANVAGFVGAA